MLVCQRDQLISKKEGSCGWGCEVKASVLHPQEHGRSTGSSVPPNTRTEGKKMSARPLEFKRRQPRYNTNRISCVGTRATVDESLKGVIPIHNSKPWDDEFGTVSFHT